MSPRSLVTFFGTLLCALPALGINAEAPPGWTEFTRSSDMVLFYRDNQEVHARELLAYTEFDAPPATVFKLVTDVDKWPQIIPYTKESKILARLTSNELITYQLISPPLVSDRDYFLRIKLIPGTPSTGGVFKSEWTSLPDYEGERKGVIRMRVNSGSWTYEPIDGGTRTRVTYSSLQHPGGALPDWLVNRSSVRIIPTLFHALRDHLAARNHPAR